MTLARAASRSALPRCTSVLPSRWHTRRLCFLCKEPQILSNRMGQTQEDSLGVRRQPQEAHIEIWNRLNLRREGEILSHCLALLGSIWSVALAPVLQCYGKPSPTSIRRSRSSTWYFVICVMSFQGSSRWVCKAYVVFNVSAC